MLVWVAITIVVATFYRLIDLPVRVEEGLPAWRRWGRATGEWWAEMTGYQMFGWQGYLVPAASLALWWWVYFPPKWERRRREAKRATKLASTTTPIEGVAELERCQKRLVIYLTVPVDSPVSQLQIAATQEFLPHVVRLCRILDEQGIPHPPIRRGLTFTGTGEWGRFLAELMAVQHDIERARRVYQGGSRS